MRKKTDITNQRFGKLTAIHRDGETKWFCRCDCGGSKSVYSYNLKNGATRSCGCISSPNLIGRKFGKLAVIEETNKRSSNGCKIYLCQCDCGNFKEILSSNIKRNKGCSAWCSREQVDIDKPTMVQLYVINNFSAAKIGKMYGVSIQPILNFLKAYGIPLKHKGIDVVCSCCGKEKITRPKYLRSNKHHFCSKSCMYEWSRMHGSDFNNRKKVDRVIVPCDYCGKEKELVPSSVKPVGYEHTFCDNKCQGQWITEFKSGPNSPNWIDNDKEYCELWRDQEYKTDIRERDGDRCMNPDCWGKCNGNTLHIHHIDYDKKNCSPSNLITLCGSCNARANFNRENHTIYYQDLMTEFYGYEYEQQLSLLEAVNQ